MLMDNMTYTNKGFISKNRILTNKGWKYLTVPLVKPNGYQTKINELLIENKSKANWKLKHLRTIKHHYEKCQGFKVFFSIIEDELMKETVNYFDLQYNLIIRILNYLNIKTKIQLGSENETGGNKEKELLVNILQDSKCDKMLLGIGASNNYVDKSYITNKGFTLLGQDFNHPVYEQPYKHEIVNGLSVIDLIFNSSREEAETIVKTCGKIKIL